MKKTMIRGVLAGAAAAFAFGVSAPAMAQETLNIWWVKGFYKAEDDSLFETIKKF